MIQLLLTNFIYKHTFFVFGCHAEAQEEESPNTTPSTQNNPYFYMELAVEGQIDANYANGDNFLIYNCR